MFLHKSPRWSEFGNRRLIAADNEKIPVGTDIDVPIVDGERTQDTRDLEGIENAYIARVDFRDHAVIHGAAWYSIFNEKKGIATWMVSTSDNVAMPERRVE